MPFSAPLVVGVGELLWDLLPGGARPGGAPANFAWHAAQLGAEGRVISAVGNDALGRDLLEHLRRLHLGGEEVAVLDGVPTGTVAVTFEAGQPRYEIVRDVAWDRIPLTEAALALAARADALCVGTLAQRSPVSRRTIGVLLDAVRPGCLRLFDLNLRGNGAEKEVVVETLARCEVLKLNDEEWPWLARLLGVSGDLEKGSFELRARQGLRAVVVTCGAKGSLVATAEGLSKRAGEAESIVVADTVGAGDSFAAAVALGLLRGEPVERFHARAAAVAAYVCTQPGATPVLPAALREGFRANSG